MRATFILIAAFAATALAGPTGQRNTCALHCTASDTFNYETGKSYVYDYSVTTSTTLLGTFDDDAKMNIKAKALIDVISPCDYVLKLTDVQLEGSAHGSEFSEAIMQHPMRFSFQDGVVENLCSEVTEPTWVLNFKRGVLSTFQNSMNQVNLKEVEETDVSGACMTEYEVSSEGDSTVVKKVKDLLSCKRRPDLTTYLMSTSYASGSPVQSLPVFKSTNNCQQKLEGGILKEAECEETHKFRPFSSEEGGAVTTIKSTMTLLSEQQSLGVSADFQFTTSSMIFEESSTESKDTVDVVEKILNDLKIASQDEIKPEVPSLFSNLVAALKSLDYPQLSTIYSKYQEPHIKKFLIDAMPLVGTASAAATLRDMVMNGEVTVGEIDHWFTSLAFLKNPDPEMFIAIAPLLEGNPSQKAMLGTSALINNYCKLHSDCESHTGVVQVIRRIEAQLGSSCRAVNAEEKNKILIALKALGNAGHWINANSVLRRCYAEEENDMEIRVASLEAWRHTPCEYDRSNVLAAFQDETQDPEVRIAAYLALMSCPTQELVNILKERLTSEGVNQVGSFIWTHMTNLQESASPEKQWMRELIGEELLQNKFRTEALKFSRNYESSFFMNELNAGATVESNVIFSSKSYLPRSAMMNLTLDLFGESINFFEVGGRIEGFESYVERFFGPSGYFPEETVEGILKNMREQKTDLEPTTLEGFLDKATDEPEGSYYMRVFGNELHYHHFRGLENVMQTSGATNPLEFLMDLARKGDVDYSKTYQLFDTHHTIPTLSGMPLSLTAKGIATVGIQMNGNFKARSLKNIDIEGHFHPSAAVEVEGVMVVDAHVTRTGLKINSNLHTSTFLDGKIKINKGKLVDVAFNTPKEKVEVINVKSKFFYLENDEEKEKDAEKIAYDGCTKGTFGIALCGEHSYTPRSGSSPMFPFTGPFGTHVYFQKTDTQSSYAMRFEKTGNEITFMADTPGSQNDHKIYASLAKSQNVLTLDIQTPFKNVKGNGEYTWRANNKQVKMSVMLDDQQYGVDASMKTDSKANKYESTLIMSNPEGEVLNLKGVLQKGDVTIEVKTPAFEALTKSHLSYNANSMLSLNTDVDYTIMNKNKQTIRQAFMVKKEDRTYSINFEFLPSEVPEKSISLDFKTTVAHLGNIESKGQLVYGPATWEVEELWLYTPERSQTKMESKMALKCLYHNIDYLASLKWQFSQNNVQGDMLLRTTPGNDMAITTSLSKNRDVEVQGSIAAQIGESKASFEVNYNKIASRHHKIQIITKVNDEPCLLEGTFQDKSSADKIDAVIEGLCKCGHYDIKSGLNILADKKNTKATVDSKTTFNGQDYTVKFEGTTTSVLLDINVIKHILFNAQVTSSSEMNKLLINAEWDKDVDPTKSFVIDGEVSTKSIHLNFRFLEKELSLSSEILPRGVMLEAKWSPDQKILCTAKYQMGETISLTTAVETPFSGWEKQDATFTITLKKHEMESRFVATWKNSEQVNLNVKASVQPGMFTNALKTNILFGSTFEGFERLTFDLDHTMTGASIQTKIQGTWDDKVMEGDFDLQPNESGLLGHLKFTSPFTHEFLMTLSHEISDKSIDSGIGLKYGVETSVMSLKGSLDFGATQEMALVLDLITPHLEEIPAITAKINYSNDGSRLSLLVDGAFGEQKIMLNMDGSLVIGETTNLKGELRFITPLTYPLTASVKHQHNHQTFTSELEMSRVWSTYGNLKLHSEGKMISKNDIEINAVLSTPENKAALSFIHNVADKKMTSSMNASLNAEKISVSVDGVLDVASSLANLDVKLVSTFNEIDDIIVNVNSTMTGETRTSKIVFKKGELSVIVDHVITITDFLNWENSFKVNGDYLLRNKQTLVSNKYNHEMEYIWGSKTVQLNINYEKKQTGQMREVLTKVSLNSPWTNDLKGELHLKYDGVEYSPDIVIEYAPGRKVELHNTIKIDEAFVYLESTLDTPFWQTLGYKFNLDFKPRSAITLVLIRGDNKTTIDVGGSLNEGKLNGTLEIHSTYLTFPVSVEVAYDMISEQKSFYAAGVYDKKYEIKATLSGNTKAAKWSVATDLPVEILKHMEFSGEYDILSMPLSTKISFILNSLKYEVNGHLNTNEFTINVLLNERSGSLSGKWSYNQTKADLEITFTSPLEALESFSIFGSYDLVDAKEVNINLTLGTQEIKLTGKLESDTLLFTAATPFSGWETIKGSFFLSDSAISAFVSRNERKIEVNGTLHVKPIKGKVSLVINTPYAHYEQISSEFTYSLQGTVKRVEFETTGFGMKKLALEGIIDVTDGLAPEMKLDITTPFDVVQKLGGMVTWNIKTTTKTAVVKVYRNDNEYQWELLVNADNLRKANVETKITAPVPGWSSVTVKGNFDFTAMPYRFTFTYEKEGTVKMFVGNFNVDHHSLSAEIITPITNWEKIQLAGDYTYERDHLTFRTKITKSSDELQMNGDVAFNTQKPNIKLILNTPISYASNIEFNLNSNLVDSQKNLLVSLKVDETIYSFNIESELSYKAGQFKLTTQAPVPGYTSLELNTKFDFTGDIKTAEVDLKKEGRNHQISVMGTVNENNVVLELHTPVEDFETLKFNGDYTTSEGEHVITGSFMKNSQKYEIKGILSTTDLSVSLKLATPIENMKNIEFKGKYALNSNGIEVFMNFVKDQEVFDLSTKVNFTPTKSDLTVTVMTPVTGWKKMQLDAHYDMQSEKKLATVTVQKDSFIKTISIEGSYTIKSGSFKIETPVEGFKVLGAEYTLNLNERANQLDSLLKLNLESKTWTFAAQGEYQYNMIMIKFQTPFEGFNTIVVSGKIDFDAKNGEGLIEFGTHKFTVNMSYEKNNAIFRMTTPFQSLKTLLLEAKYTLTESTKNAELNLKYNDKLFSLKGDTKLSLKTSEVLFQVTTPIQSFSNIVVKAKYDTENRDELVSFKLATNDVTYEFQMGGYIEEKLALLTCVLRSPLPGWTEVKFTSKIDLTLDDKNIEITMERDGDVKMISISGKFIGETLNFNLKTPFVGLHDFKIFGSLNRAKRSVDFQMMKDASRVSFAGNFNSVSLELKTPFEAAENVKWEIVKTSDNTLKAHWQRNDNYIDIKAQKIGKKAAFNLEVKSAFQGWEFLALTGRMDQETLKGYLSGQLDEDKVSIEGEGNFDTKGGMTLKIETPYANYREVDVKLEYNVRKSTMKLEASSTSSDFHFILERNRSGVLSHHSIFPNAVKPTEITMNLGIYRGKVTITSRFPFLRDYHQEYDAQIGPVITITHLIRRNGNDVFKLDAKRDGPNKKLDVEVHVHSGPMHTRIELHRDAYSSLHFLVNTNDSKEFRIDVSGSGNLPSQGVIDVEVNNSFRASPRNIKAHITVDVRQSAARKHIKLEVTTTGSRLYVFDLDYSIDRATYKHGDFKLGITTPDRRMAPWKSVLGSWDLRDQANTNIKFNMGGMEYIARGMLTLQESNLVLVPSKGGDNIFLQWTFKRSGSDKDYFLKVGRESMYGMMKLKGRITDYAHVDVEGGFKLGPLMSKEFLFTSRWNKGADNSVEGGGSFEYGRQKGEHTVKFQYNRALRTATFEVAGTSNVRNYQRLKISGSFDFNRKVVMHAEINANDRISKFEVNFSDLNPRKSLNTMSVNIPLFGEYGQMELTFSHDFTNPTAKSLSVVARLATREAYFKANWNRSPNFDKIEGNIDIKSRFVGEVHINMNFDVSDTSNAHAEVNYSRTTSAGQTRNASLKWSRKRTPTDLKGELVIETPYPTLRHGRVFVNADFKNIFHLSSGADYNDKHVTMELDIKKKSVTGKITTPIPGFELIEGSLNFNLGGKSKSVHLEYVRGTRKVNLDISLNMKPKKEGNFDLKLNTPFEFAKNLHIDGSWSKKKAQINYQRNDIAMNFSGKADIKADKSSFDMSFAPPSGQTIRIAGSYDVEEFLAGSGSSDKKIASVELEFDGNNVGMNIHGYRNSERLALQLDGKSSFARVKNFHLKLDTALSTQQGDGIIEVLVNDFVLKIENHFERRGSDGFYFKCQIESSLTPLPALIFGIGRTGEKRIVTIGYGEDKEITFSIQGKNNFESGFSGHVDIPNFGYEGVEYDVEYGFKNRDEIYINVELELGGDKEVEAHFLYNSDGVMARLDSLVMGHHSVRVRRSITTEGFFAEAGFDDYNLKLRGGFDNDDTKRGFQLEGEVFGRIFLIDTLLQSEGMKYTEGKLIIETPFQGWEKLGGLFTWAYVNNKVVSHAEVMLPSFVIPKITAEINMNLNKKIEGHISFNLAGEEFILRSNLVGSGSEGFKGSLELNTPFHALSFVNIDGSFKMQSLEVLEADLKIAAPFATHEVKVNYRLNTNKLMADVVLQSTRLQQTYKVDLTLEKTGPTSGKLHLEVNDNTLTFEGDIKPQHLKMNMDSNIMNVQRQFSLEANYPSLNDMNGTLIVILSGQTHRIHGNMITTLNHIKGSLEVESALIEGQRKLSFDMHLPFESLKQVFCDIAYISHQSHFIHFESDIRSGIHLVFYLDTPLFPEVKTAFDLTVASAGLSIETPQGLHKMLASWKATRKMPSDLMGSVELVSPLLPVNYRAGVVLGGNPEQRTFKAELDAGSVKHLVEGFVAMSPNGGSFSLVLETPIKRINKASIETSLNFNDKIEMHISSTIFAKIHTFDLTFDKQSKLFSAVVESPFIPTGMVTAEAQLSGDMNKNIQAMMELKNNAKTISGMFNFKVISPQNIKTSLKITTPFKGYKKMNFNVQYKKGDDDLVILITTEKPVKFNAELRLGNFNENVKVDLKINTNIKGFENIEGHLLIPLTTFEPRVSANVFVDGVYYGGHFGLRTKAPYELAYGLHLGNMVDTKFHIRTDSSFFVFLS